MSIETEEKLSSLIDGELSANDAKETLDKLCADKTLREQWHRHHLMRDSLQGESSGQYLGSDFSSGVMAALENDDTPSLTESANVVSADFTAKKKKAPTTSPAWMRPVAGLAVAASVAMVSVAGLNFIQSPSDTGLPVVADADTLVNDAPVAQLAFQPASSADFKRVNNTGTYWVVNNEKVRDSELESHLNGYLSDHIEFATMRNVGGMLPYSKLVGYDEIRK